VQCLACINRCPVKAIQYGSSTRRRTRYENPVLKMMMDLSNDDPGSEAK
jgi:ferredoxin